MYDLDMDVTNLEIENKCGASTICFGNALNLIYKHLPKYRRVIVITDENVAGRYRNLLRHFEQIVIGVGEGNKNLQTAMMVYERLMEMGADTHSYLLGVGGGIVTDITGFVAATYMRGMDFSFVPTTLLSQVDASIGGKNGVNFHDYKNMVGTIRQPEFVICDVVMLHTLPEREFRAGLAEVIKTAILGDSELFEILEHTSCKELRKNDNLLEEIILRSMKVKASVVAEDEREGGRRRILNLGHTIAHAIEKSTSKFSHGEAVAIGLHHITHVALSQGLISVNDAERIFALIDHYGFDTTQPITHKQLLDAIKADKKRSGNTLHLILPTAIGAVVDKVVTFEELNTIL